MTVLRRYLSGVLAKGYIGPGWYAVLTGAAMLFLAWVLASVRDTDRAAPFVAFVLAVTGVWSLQRGVRLELRRRRA